METELGSILKSCCEGGIAYSPMRETTLRFNVPRNSTHEFWRQRGLNKDDGNFKDSTATEITVVGFGPTESESKGNAMLTLLQLIELVRRLIQHQSFLSRQSLAVMGPQCELEISEHIRNELKQVSLSAILETDIYDSNDALNMALRLSGVYKDLEHCFRRCEDKLWTDIAGVLEDCTKRFPALQTLLLYYLIQSTPSLFYAIFFCPVLLSMSLFSQRQLD